MPWSQSDILRLKSLAKRKPFFKDIASEMGRRPGAVLCAAKKYGIKLSRPGKMGEWNLQHSHIREKVMTYFLNHTAEETRKKFGLTESQFKSLQTVAYRMPELSHLRKDKRTKKLWDVKDDLFVLRWSGIQSRSWISEKLGRASKDGSFHSIKDRVRSLNISTKYVNGIPERWVNELFKLYPQSIKTKAGPVSERSNFQFKIVPWVLLYRHVRSNKKIPQHLKDAVRAMSKFQKFIHGTKNETEIIRRIKNAAKK